MPYALQRIHWTLAAILLLGLMAQTEAKERQIYPDPGHAKADIAAALESAAATHKRVILDFGGNWCPDCQALYNYFHDEANQSIVAENFIVVYVNIGLRDANLDIAARYRIPLEKGVPALAVLGSDGELLFSQRTGEFEAMRHMQSSSVTGFLEQWKAAPRS
jgi:thiol:disulfide interchange protein